ncbi:MAG: IgGFc-binding protein [Nannocystaceae bacterium]
MRRLTTPPNTPLTAPLIALALLAACTGDDAVGESDTATTEASSTAGSSTTAGTSTATTTTAGTTTQGGTMSGTESTSTTAGETTTSTTSTTDTTVGTTTDTSTTTEGTTDPTDTSTSEPITTTDSDTDTSTTGEPLVCDPGASECVDDKNYQVCADDGLSWEPPVACAANESCANGGCYSACDLVKLNPSSVGCSFVTTKMDNIFSNVNAPDQNDSLIAGNISKTDAVKAQLYFVNLNSNVEMPQGAPVMIPPKGTATFVLSVAEIDSLTTTQQGGVYRLETDRPIVAYRHSPIGSTATNDASMLLPDHALTGNYVITSYPGTIGPYPSYFTAIAIDDNTTVDFTVKGSAIAGGGGIPALGPNQSGQVKLNRYQLMNVVVSQQQGGDLSGTTVTASGPLTVIGATECANVINASQTFCDHAEEAPFPLEYWGKEYVGPTSPKRGSESTHWRVYGGEDGTTVNTTPAQPGFPKMLNKGEFYQFATKENLIFSGDKPFLPVAYLESQNPNAGTGDPAMYQMVPTAQFLSSYAFVTGTNYNQHYAQIIRPKGGAEVMLDGNMVGGYVAVGNYEVANVLTSEGAHFAESNAPFGILQIGYTPVTSYAYPGGLKLEVINPQ